MKIIILMFGLVLFFTINSCKSDGARSFYCLSEDRCITIWKTGNRDVLIVYGIYNDSKKPVDDYVKLVDITNEVDWYASVIFTKDAKLLIDVIDDSTKVISQSSLGIIELYNSKKTLNDSLYTYYDGKYKRYKKEVDYISVNIKENYATDKNGNKLR
ncbi:hypothetical protein ACYSNX_13045 [Myroides sp. LJL115]